MKLKEAFAVVILLLGMFGVMICISIPSFAQEPGDSLLSPENPEFLSYLRNNSGMQIEAMSDFSPGLIPESIVLPRSTGAGSRSLSATLPAIFDLRTLGKLNPVRDQGQCGSCWAFASCGSLESSLLPGETLDLSENNLKNLHGYSIPHNAGGNRTMSTAYLASWAGPVTESNDPYNPSSGVSPQGLLSVKHVQDVIYIPGRASALDNSAIKQAIMTYGAMYTTYCHSSSYYNTATASYNYTSTGSPNHAVCIVGWDDNYPATKFLNLPAGNGAFLIRNSWGSWWATGGYFWISYYDARLAKSENAIFLTEPASNYKTIYQYDDLGWVSSVGWSNNTAWFANVFTASASESISAVSWYSASPNSTYAVYVYTDPTSGPINPSGYVSSTTGAMATAGYHTLKLSQLLPVTVGQKFSVVVKLITPGYNYPIPIEMPYSGYSDAATASAGQSYLSALGSSWSDATTYYPNSNVCLKAFSQGTSTPTAGALAVTPVSAMTATGPHLGPFTAKQSYILTNTGQSDIDWTASNIGQTWLSLSNTGGTLASGTTVTVEVSINSEADSLDPGIYNDTVTFTNTTNGKGNATRAVKLTVIPDPGILTLTGADSINYTGFVGGPFQSVSKTCTLTNTGASALSWNSPKVGSWITCTPSSGALAKGASTTVTITLNSAATLLVAGDYVGTVNFTNTTTGKGNTSLPITLQVMQGSYLMMPETYAWTSPAKTTRLILADNAVSAAVAIPFTFTFYGKTYTKIYVGSNGLIGFGTTGMTSYANTDLPRTAAPNAAIYPYWTNLNPARGGYVNVGTVGVAPNRALVISWADVPWGTTSVKFRFQTLLYEATSDIVFQYANVSTANLTYGAGKKATIGIENANGTLASRYSYNTYGTVKNNRAIRIGVR
ncbi:MAG: lectin like domain-containing protein [Armatimonadetes bacterium]|nr:lectin like domain-containing protein [Armatimonadota bacterium]